VALQKEMSALEVRTLLSGEYDQREALVQITPAPAASTARTGR
jgi:hypothetical protein